MKPGHHPSSRAKRDREAAAATNLVDAPRNEDRDEFVRRTAYSYYEARGRIHGHELDDWLRAEAEFERMSAAREGGTASGH